MHRLNLEQLGPAASRGPHTASRGADLSSPPEAVGDWLQCGSGVRLDLRHPLPQQVNIEDVAQALGNTPRWGGRCGFYSVAQHSVFVSRLCPAELALEGLLHDAHEAYLGDVPTPIKKLLGDSWYTLEHRVRRAVAQRFDVFACPPELVRYADRLALLLEARVFYPDEWKEFAGYHAAPALARQMAENVNPARLNDALRRLGPDQAREAFLDRWHELNAAQENP